MYTAQNGKLEKVRPEDEKPAVFNTIKSDDPLLDMAANTVIFVKKLRAIMEDFI